MGSAEMPRCIQHHLHSLRNQVHPVTRSSCLTAFRPFAFQVPAHDVKGRISGPDSFWQGHSDCRALKDITMMHSHIYKWIAHPKIKILSSFTHPHLWISFLMEHRMRIWRIVLDAVFCAFSYRFGLTWEWVNDDKILLLKWTTPL